MLVQPAMAKDEEAIAKQTSVAGQILATSRDLGLPQSLFKVKMFFLGLVNW